MWHGSAPRWRRGALALGGALALACVPLRGDELRTAPTPAGLTSNEVHFVVRANADALGRGEHVAITASVPAESVDGLVLLPDDPELTGVSIGSGPFFPNLNASLELAEILRARCADDGICEVGLTAIVTPSTDAGATAPSEITLTVQAVTEPEEQFLESASVELEVDGEAPVIARRLGT